MASLHKGAAGEEAEGELSRASTFGGGSGSELDEVVRRELDDALRTMAVVEAAYLSSASGATAIPRDE